MYLEILLTVWFILWLFFKFSHNSNVIDPEVLKKYAPKSFKEAIDENRKLNNKK